MPYPVLGLRLTILSIAAALALPTGVHAENFLKQQPLPTPKAGPTIAAAQKFCGDPADKADVLIDRYSKAENLKKVYESADYVAYADDEKAPTMMYTFTTKKNAAYPAAVCRKTVKEGDNLVMKMEIVCDGKEEACGQLSKDFTAMNAVMQSQVDTKINDASAKK
jgi:hypothetical protein